MILARSAVAHVHRRRGGCSFYEAAFKPTASKQSSKVIMPVGRLNMRDGSEINPIAPYPDARPGGTWGLKSLAPYHLYSLPFLIIRY